MAEAVVMPRQGQSVETCIITQWLKNKGDRVEEGELLFSYETDKAAFDEVAPVSGTLLEILHEEGDEVPVLQTVAFIGKPGEKTDDIPGANATESHAAGGTKDGPRKEATVEDGPGEDPTEGQPGSKDDGRPGSGSTDGTSTGEVPSDGQSVSKDDGRPGSGSSDGTSPGEVPSDGQSGSAASGVPAEPATGGAERRGSGIRISPRARNMAKAMQVDITSLRGSGPNGRIIADDVEAAAARLQETQPAEGDDLTDQPLSNIRKVIARNMKASLDNSAQLTHHASADARKILSLRKKIKEGSEQHLPASTTLNDMVCHAIVQALRETPGINSHFLGDRIRSFSAVHLGMAVDTPRGLMVPVMKNADRLTLGGLGQSLRELAESCKNGNIDPDLLAAEAGSFTVSNLGAFGIEMFTPVLNLPQTGIIGINTITHRPADLGDGNIGFIPHIGISLTYDHRAIDGAPASRFLQEVCNRIAGFDPTL